MKTKDEGWKMKDEGWRMKEGGWRMEDEGWRMKDEGWRMKDEGWRVYYTIMGTYHKYVRSTEPKSPQVDVSDEDLVLQGWLVPLDRN